MALLRNSKLSLASVFFTFFIDNLCWAIVFPIFAPYFRDSQNVVFSADVSVETRILLLGVFLSAFSLGQFLGAPVLGEYADRFGRKKAFLFSIFMSCLGLALSAWSMEMHLLTALFFGRLITGIFAGNLTICLATVADISQDEKTRVQYFGYLAFVAGFAFVLGGFAGGKFSDPTVSSLFTPSLPLWIATCLVGLNLIFIAIFFRETKIIEPDLKFDFLESFHNIQEALKTKKIKTIYLIYFMFLFAWTVLFQFTPILLVKKFSFSGSNLGDLALYIGVCWAIGSGYLGKLLLRRFSSLRVLEICLLLFTGFFIALSFAETLVAVLIFVGFAVMTAGLAWPICTGVISSKAPEKMEGKILGISQSVQSLAIGIAPFIAGFAFRYSFVLVFSIGALASFIAAILYFSLRED